jgi:protein ImuB
MLTAAAIAERVRWQLDGWLTGARRGGATARGEGRPTAGIVRLRLIPDGVLVHLGLQAGLWGDAGAERERAHRALSRIQGLLGPEAVVTAVPGGGRSADDQVRLVPWGDERVPDRPTAEHTEPIPGTATAPVLTQTLRLVTTLDDEQPAGAGPPWPGRLPIPSPALVLTSPQPAVVVDGAGAPVGVSARLELTGEPAGLLLGNNTPVEITGWAGPWPVDERWWAPAEARRRARFQIGVADGRAFLLALSGGHWTVEAVYD